MNEVLLVLLVALPVGLIAAWVFVLRARGVPGPWFFLVGAALVPAVLLLGETAQRIEDQGLPADCRTGVAVGMTCGFGVGRLLGLLDAAVVVACLVALAVASAAVAWSRRRRERAGYRGLPALVNDQIRS